MLSLCSQPLSCILLTWLSCSLLPTDLHHFSCALFDCPVSSSVETVCGWFPSTQMTRAKVRSFHDSFPLCCTQWMVFWVSHSDAKHRRDFLHMQAPRLRYALNWKNWVLNISLKFLYFFPDDFISPFVSPFFVSDDSDLRMLPTPWRTFGYLVESHRILT